MDLNLLQMRENDSTAAVNLKMGMYAPQFNPWWSPDLGLTSLPDYHKIHELMFLSRDIGAQLTIRPTGKEFEFG